MKSNGTPLSPNACAVLSRCAALLLFALAGCTSVVVRSVDSGLSLDRVCIRENPKVQVADFLDVVRDAFDRHGITATVIAEGAAADCEYIVTYTALRSWDIAPYLSHAEITIESDGKQVAHATYHLRGKARPSLYKWDDTKAKIDPVMEELLKYQNHPWKKRGL